MGRNLESRGRVTDQENRVVFRLWIESSMASELVNSGMLSREQLFHLFDRFSFLVTQPEVKKRIADAVLDKQEAVAMTTAIQEEIFIDMGVDPRFGISCLGKVTSVYENDQDLVIHFYKFLANFIFLLFPMLKDLLSGEIVPIFIGFVSYDYHLLLLVVSMLRRAFFIKREEMACDEAELGEEGFAEKIQDQQKLQEQQLEMLKHMRKFQLDDQSAILEKLHQQMENGNYESVTCILSAEQMEEIVQRKVSPVFMPR